MCAALSQAFSRHRGRHRGLQLRHRQGGELLYHAWSFAEQNSLAERRRRSAGIAGDNLGTVVRCYSIAEVTGNNAVGGVVGTNGGGSVNSCVAMNRVVRRTGSAAILIGRVVGNDASGTMGGNRARNDGNLVMYNGTGSVTVAPSATTQAGKDGENATAANTHGTNSSTWWPNVGFSSANWQTRNSNIPILRVKPDSFFVDAQNPIP